ncbi:hypothetical protein GCM10023092_12510 [Rurimicrobium arvi]|uniref:Uncharacterized protein n=2 Tax=Rurimicrobium arvi TaxID=2049916 RepID=A0ABP8MM17_9BACT
MLRLSIPPIYERADQICLSIDESRVSWSGNKFSWDQEGFMKMLAELDPKGKIRLFEANFYVPTLTPMQNEVRQRNEIAKFIGGDGWHIQLDTDEIFLNFEGFVHYLQSFRSRRKVNIACPWITAYKQTEDGFFFVKPSDFSQIEFIQIATLHPDYEYGRRNGNFNVRSPFALLHLSWARSEQEIWEKINNWGHKDDIDIQGEFDRWKNLSADNFHTYRNFHPVVPEAWPALGFIAAKDVAHLMALPEGTIRLPLTKRKLRIENSIWVSRAKKYLRFKR